jgi:hypothetical protein
MAALFVLWASGCAASPRRSLGSFASDLGRAEPFRSSLRQSRAASEFGSVPKKSPSAHHCGRAARLPSLEVCQRRALPLIIAAEPGGFRGKKRTKEDSSAHHCGRAARLPSLETCQRRALPLIIAAEPQNPGSLRLRGCLYLPLLGGMVETLPPSAIW